MLLPLERSTWRFKPTPKGGINLRTAGSRGRTCSITKSLRSGLITFPGLLFLILVFWLLYHWHWFLMLKDMASHERFGLANRRTRIASDHTFSADDLGSHNDSSSLNATLGRGRSATRLPTVNRSILEKLALLKKKNLEDMQEDDLDLNDSGKNSKEEENATTVRVPKILQFPLPSAAALDYPSQFDIVAYDKRFCGTHPCRLLIPTWVADQGPKSASNFLQVHSLARTLNRTLVLPNVGKNRMGSCFKLSFAMYYDVRGLMDDLKRINVDDSLRGAPVVEESNNGISHEEGSTSIRPLVTFTDFVRWVAGRSQEPEVQIIIASSSLSPAILEPPNIPVPVTATGNSELLDVSFKLDSATEPSQARHNHCLRNKVPRLAFDRFFPLHVSPASSEGLHNFPLALKNLLGTPIARTLRQLPVNGSSGDFDLTSGGLDSNEIVYNTTDAEPLGIPDVLALDYDFHSQSFPRDNLGLSLRPSLSASSLVNTVSQLIQPHVVVYWSTESLPTDQLQSCARALVEGVSDTLTDPEVLIFSNLENVFLVSDIFDKQRQYAGHKVPLPARLTRRRWAKKANILAEEYTSAAAILRDAFKPGAILDSFNLVSLSDLVLPDDRNDTGGRNMTGALEERVPRNPGLDSMSLSRMGTEKEMLDDLGIRHAVNTEMSLRADYFFSASKQCGQVGSFVRQIVDGRRAIKKSSRTRARMSSTSATTASRSRATNVNPNTTGVIYQEPNNNLFSNPGVGTMSSEPAQDQKAHEIEISNVVQYFG